MGSNALHSELSPSKRHRWGACPGSIRLEALYPEKPAGKAAEDGTLTHAFLEDVIKRGMWETPVPLTMVGTTHTYPDGEGGTLTLTLDADRIERVNVALNYIRERAKAAKVTPIAEKRVFPDGLTGRADLHGTVDVQLPGVEVYEIIDYKDGLSPVSAENNPQLEQYALGVLASLEKPPVSFQLTIVQPKLALKGMDPISTWNIPTNALLDRVLPTIIAQAAATDAPDAPLVPGEDQCKYCRAKGGCPALGNAVNEVINMYGPVIDVQAVDVTPQGTDLTAPQALAQKDPHSMTDAEMRKVMEMAPLIRGFIEGVESEVQRRLENGLVVEGLKLVAGRGSRSWALGEDETVKVLTGMGIPKASLYESKLVTPAKAEKLVWDKKGEAQKLSDKQLARLKAEYIIHQSGKPTVALASDPREAISFNTAPMFAPIETTSLPPFLQVAAPVVETTPIPDWMAMPSWLQ